MPKIALRYTGDDEAHKKSLESTGGVMYVEPVDAREILASPGNEYEPDEDSRKLIGIHFDPRLKGLNVPQLQGENAELQTGLSAEKYGRAQVVKAVPDSSMPTAMRPFTTTGRPLSLDEAREGTAGTQRDDFEQQEPVAPLSHGKSKEELKNELRKRDVEFPSNASKDELAELLDSQTA